MQEDDSAMNFSKTKGFFVAAWPRRRCRLFFRVWKKSLFALTETSADKIFQQKRHWWGFKPGVSWQLMCLVCFLQTIYTWNCTVHWQFGCGNWHLDRMSKSFGESLIHLLFLRVLPRQTISWNPFRISQNFLERENNVTKDRPANFVVLVYLVAWFPKKFAMRAFDSGGQATKGAWGMSWH